MTGIKYPDVAIALTGEDGNAFAILGRVTGALRRAGVDKAERDAFVAEATSGDYDNLLRTVLGWVSTYETALGPVNTYETVLGWVSTDEEDSDE